MVKVDSDYYRRRAEVPTETFAVAHPSGCRRHLPFTRSWVTTGLHRDLRPPLNIHMVRERGQGETIRKVKYSSVRIEKLLLVLYMSAEYFSLARTFRTVWGGTLCVAVISLPLSQGFSTLHDIDASRCRVAEISDNLAGVLMV